MDTTDNQNDSDTFDLGNFISAQSELFVTMGVFGALAIYISQSTTSNTPDTELVINTGLVSSFGLSMLMFALIYSKLIDEFGDFHTLYHAHFRPQNAPLLIFSFFSVMLILSLSTILTQHESVIFLLLNVGTMFVGLGVMTQFLYGIGKRIPDSPMWRILALFLTSSAVLLIIRHLQTNLLTQYQMTTIHNLSLSNPMPILITISLILIATIQSGAAIGVIASIIGVPLVIIDTFRGKIP